jgi:ferredoxin-NADP reductase
MMDETYLAQAAEIRQLTADVRELTFRMVDPPTLEFRAGQAISVRGGSFFEKRMKRTYSLASPPSLKDRFTLSVRLVGGYKGTEFMRRIQVGDTMSFMPPFGDFVVDPARSGPLVFVATGTGTSPCRAIIHDLLGKDGGRPMTFYFGVARPEDIIYEEEFRTLEKAHPNFRYVPTVTEPGSCWNGRRGKVADLIRHLQELPQEADWYLSGNGAMIDEVQDILRARGVPVDRVHIEKYFPAFPPS